MVCKVIRNRPLLTWRVRSVLALVRTSTRTTRHLLTVACVVAVILAVKEEVLSKKRISYTCIYKANNLSHYAQLTELKDIVSQAGTRDFTIQLSRAVVLRRRGRTGAESNPSLSHTLTLFIHLYYKLQPHLSYILDLTLIIPVYPRLHSDG